MVLDFACVGLGGCIGAMIRYAMVRAFPVGAWPWTTLAINVIGSFAIGLLAALVARDLLTNPRLALLLQVGVCGGFTAFSAMSLEVVGMIGEGRLLTGIVYVAISGTLGVLAAIAGGAVVGS